MMSSIRYAANKRWRNRLHAALITEMGGRCEECGSLAPLEFAHKEPTGLSGPGRGRDKRLLDVRRNMSKYRLLCKGCHVDYDATRNYSSQAGEVLEPQWISRHHILP